MLEIIEFAKVCNKTDDKLKSCTSKISIKTQTKKKLS